MEIIIKIKDTTYKAITTLNKISDHLQEEVTDAIKNGKSLPKGHGRLIDVDVATKSIDAFHDSFVRECDMLSGKFSIVCTAPTVIEADREAEDGN